LKRDQSTGPSVRAARRMNAGSDLVAIESFSDVSNNSDMWLDIATPKSAAIAIVGFFVALTLTLWAGLSGPEPFTVERTEHHFRNMTSQLYHFEVAHISGYNRFLSFGISFIRASAAAPVPPLLFHYRVECSTRSWHSVRVDYVTPAFIPPYVPAQQLTTRLTLFKDTFIRYYLAQLAVGLPIPNVTLIRGLVLYTTLGAPEHTTFQAYFRAVFAAFDLALLCRIPRLWPTQKLVALLLFFAFIWNNPLWVVHAWRARFLFLALDVVTAPLFRGLVCYIVLNTSGATGYSIAALVVLIAAAELASLAYETVFVVIPRPLLADPVRTALDVVRWACNAVFALVGAVAVARSPNWLYVFVNGIVVAVVALLDVVGKAFRLFEWTAVEVVVGFVVLNLYVLMMAYLHWPIDREKARKYEGGVSTQVRDLLGTSDVSDLSSDSEHLVSEMGV
jgi:hypothetical protein